MWRRRFRAGRQRRITGTARSRRGQAGQGRCSPYDLCTDLQGGCKGSCSRHPGSLPRLAEHARPSARQSGHTFLDAWILLRHALPNHTCSEKFKLPIAKAFCSSTTEMEPLPSRSTARNHCRAVERCRPTHCILSISGAVHMLSATSSAVQAGFTCSKLALAWEGRCWQVQLTSYLLQLLRVLRLLLLLLHVTRTSEDLLSVNTISPSSLQTGLRPLIADSTQRLEMETKLKAMQARYTAELQGLQDGQQGKKTTHSRPRLLC